MKAETKKLQGAKERFGAEVTVNKRLDEIAKQTLFPKKLKEANKILSAVKFK